MGALEPLAPIGGSSFSRDAPFFREPPRQFSREGPSFAPAPSSSSRHASSSPPSSSGSTHDDPIKRTQQGTPGNVPLRGQYSGVYYGCTRPNVVALTFDDGPADHTNELVDYLLENRVPATFFVNGNNYQDVREHPWSDVVIRIANAPLLQLGLHGWSHVDLAALDEDELEEEIGGLMRVLNRITGKSPRFLRPPFGSFNAQSLAVARRLNVETVIWNVDTKDAENPGDVVSAMSVVTSEIEPASSRGGDSGRGGANALSDIKPDGNEGYILLQHDPVESTSRQLAQRVVDYVRRQGLEFVTVADCVGQKGREYL